LILLTFFAELAPTQNGPRDSETMTSHVCKFFNDCSSDCSTFSPTFEIGLSLAAVVPTTTTNADKLRAGLLVHWPKVWI
jgi:hypothetical protein